MITEQMFRKLHLLRTQQGYSIREISRRTGLSRTTVKHWLKVDVLTKPKYHRKPRATLLTPFEDRLNTWLDEDVDRPVNDQKTALAIFEELQREGFTGCYSLVTDYIRHWRAAKGSALKTAFVPVQSVPGDDSIVINGLYRKLLVADSKNDSARIYEKPDLVKQRWMEWLYMLEQQPDVVHQSFLGPGEEIAGLSPSPNNPRKKALVVLARKKGLSRNTIAEHLGVTRKTVKNYLDDFRAGGTKLLFGRKRKSLKSENPELRKAVFSLLHEPPSLSGFNRTTWRIGANLRFPLTH